MGDLYVNPIIEILKRKKEKKNMKGKEKLKQGKGSHFFFSALVGKLDQL